MYRIMIDNKMLCHKFSSLQKAEWMLIDYCRTAKEFGSTIKLLDNVEVQISWPYPDNKTEIIKIVKE